MARGTQMSFQCPSSDTDGERQSDAGDRCARGILGGGTGAVPGSPESAGNAGDETLAAINDSDDSDSPTGGNLRHPRPERQAMRRWPPSKAPRPTGGNLRRKPRVRRLLGGGAFVPPVATSWTRWHPHHDEQVQHGALKMRRWPPLPRPELPGRPRRLDSLGQAHRQPSARPRRHNRASLATVRTWTHGPCRTRRRPAVRGPKRRSAALFARPDTRLGSLASCPEIQPPRTPRPREDHQQRPFVPEQVGRRRSVQWCRGFVLLAARTHRARATGMRHTHENRLA